MSCEPPIGVVIPARNAAAWLGTALRSLRAQTLPDWRAVVVDDGSTDATAAVAAGFADPRIAVIRQPPAGVSVARNGGIAALGAAAALLFLDADDWLAPDALARLAPALGAAPGAVAACGPYATVDAEADALFAPHSTGPVKVAAGGDLLARLLTRNLFANGGHLLIRADAVRRAGGFRTDLTFGEDWEYWVRVAALGPYVAARGRAPVLFVRRRADGACLRAAPDPAAFAPALDAAFTHPVLAARFGPARLARLRRRMTAEAEWVAGRALLWHGQRAAALHCLHRAWLARPSLRRAALLALWHLRGWRGASRQEDTGRSVPAARQPNDRIPRAAPGAGLG